MDNSHATGWASDAPTPAQLKELFAQIESGRMNKKRLQSILGEAVEQSAANIFPVIVDYSRTLSEMISAGKYGWVNSDITDQHFPLPKIPTGLPTKLELNLELVHFNRFISSNDAIAELKKRGMRPATLPELLAFGEQYPEEQRKYSIVALGSVWQDWGGRIVPCLWFDAVGRGLGLSWFEGGWGDGYRFLAVRES